MDGDGNFDGLSAMGFSVLQNFEEVSCDAATCKSHWRREGVPLIETMSIRGRHALSLSMAFQLRDAC